VKLSESTEIASNFPSWHKSADAVSKNMSGEKSSGFDVGACVLEANVECVSWASVSRIENLTALAAVVFSFETGLFV